MTRRSSKFKVRSSKRRAALVAVAASAVLVAILAAQQLPRFRAGVDVVEMDVSVLDKDHKPVRGLKASDFTILEDGQPQTVVAFSEESEQPVAKPTAPWVRDVPKDVVTNKIDDKHLFVIILDDAELGMDIITDPVPKSPTGPGKPAVPAPNLDVYEVDTMRKVARRAVDLMGEGDEAAILFTNDNFKGQTFTGNRALLLRAIDSVTMGPKYATDRIEPRKTDCQQVWFPSEALRDAVSALSSQPHRRKTIIFVSVGSAIPIIGHPLPEFMYCVDKAQDNVLEAFKYAQRANVNIYSLDPGGLRTRYSDQDRARHEFLSEVAENTGGRAVLDTNDDVGRVTDIIAETRAYYILGYELAHRKGDGQFHRVEVKVNRPGVDVHSRTMRFDAGPPKPAAAAAEVKSPTDSAVSEFLPKNDLLLGVSVAPFASSAGGTVLVTINGQLPPANPAPTRDHLDLLVRAFTPDGRAAGTHQELAQVALDSPAHAEASAPATVGPGFEASTRLDLKPGRYSLRIAVHSAASDKTGSVYTDVEVPDFSKDPLSVSGLILTPSGSVSSRGDALASLVSTTRRAFASTDRIQVFLRVFQAGPELGGVTVRTRIVDDHNTTVRDKPELIPASAFGRLRQADFMSPVPLTALKPGEYLLAIEVSSGKLTARRNLRFAVK